MLAHFTVCAKGCCKGRLAGFLFKQTWVTMVCIVQCIFRCKERKLEMLLMITQPIRCTRFVPPTTRQDSRVPNFIGPKLTRRYIVRLSTLRPATVLVCFIPDCAEVLTSPADCIWDRGQRDSIQDYFNYRSSKLISLCQPALVRL